MDYKIQKFKKFKDSRGSLIVFLQESELNDAKKKFGQIYFVTFKDHGVIRGNHYHKKWHEWFGITSGRVQVYLEDVRTQQRVELTLSANIDKYIRLEIGPYIAHTFKSITKSAVLLNYADSQWSAEDTFKYKII